ncbi:ABC transporter ATP-binding protein [Agrococcus jejuensis]|uniref:ABC-2 type transport system ATP-binding protein n=1 Tax=Agrococcus jejuensis TaxID=399736 RepID=A0A1G8BLW3_9MICO|nr:ABC transporter ATP-binding protein [Agrococcus jejuensis]SDH34103.1 ABC-2 type transport system ATP-binding protein [Agrococcus jejuensis]
MSAIEVEGLGATLGARCVLDDVAFAVPWGSVTGFLGVNGAGKSTTIRAMVGLVARHGVVRVAGADPLRMPNQARVLGVAFDELMADPQHTTLGHLQQLAVRAGVDGTRANAALEAVGLASHEAGRGRRPPRIAALSLGMRKRLAIAGALVAGPRVLVLDEPFDGLDPTGRRWLRELVREHADRGGAVLLSAHGLDEIASVLDDVVVLDAGRVRFAGTTRALLAPTASFVVVRSPDAAALRAALEAGGASVEVVGTGVLHVRGSTTEAVARVALDRRLLVVELTTAEQTLSDAFVAAIGRA